MSLKWVNIDCICKGLCWIRLVTLSVRIAWAVYPTSIRLGIAAQILVYVGTVLLYFVDLFMMERIVRAQHPYFGWTKPFSLVVPVMCLIAVLSVVMVVVTGIQMSYTLSTNTLRIDRDVRLFVETAFAVIAAVPLFVVLLSTLIRQLPAIKHSNTMDKFGAGSMRAKILMVCFASFILAFADSFKAGTDYFPELPLSASTPWYYTRGVFYGLGLAPEIIVLYMWAIFAINHRFVIPDGARGPFSYAGGFTFAGETGNEKRTLGNRDSTRDLVGSSPSLAHSGRSGRSGRSSSRGRESVISWGGIYPENAEPDLGEDGSEMVPYSNIVGPEDLGVPIGVSGIQQEMGWDAKSGQWKLRPISGKSNHSSAGALPMTAQEHV